MMKSVLDKRELSLSVIVMILGLLLPGWAHGSGTAGYALSWPASQMSGDDTSPLKPLCCLTVSQARLGLPAVGTESVHRKIMSGPSGSRPTLAQADSSSNVTADDVKKALADQLAELQAISTELDRLMPLAERGDAGALFEAAKILESPLLTPENEPQAEPTKSALRFYYLAAQRGHPAAQYHLGKRYAEARDVKKDDGKAVYWFREAAKQRHPEACLELGERYQDGRGVVKDVKQAIYFYGLAADQTAAPQISEKAASAIRSLGYAR